MLRSLSSSEYWLLFHETLELNSQVISMEILVLTLSGFYYFTLKIKKVAVKGVGLSPTNRCSWCHPATSVHDVFLQSYIVSNVVSKNSNTKLLYVVSVAATFSVEESNFLPTIARPGFNFNLNLMHSLIENRVTLLNIFCIASRKTVVKSMLIKKSEIDQW